MTDQEISRSPDPATPEWTRQPFNDFLSYCEQLAELLEVCITGIHTLPAVPTMHDIIHVIDNIVPLDRTIPEFDKERSLRLAELAKKENSTGFPLLHAQASVSLWGALEDLMRTFVSLWLQKVPDVRLTLPLSAIRIELGEYERLTPEEKGNFLYENLDRELKATFKPGIARFEALLKALGLSGSFPAEQRKDVLELGQLRHVFVHRRGMVDQRLLDACPWLTIPLGSAVSISHSDFCRYYTAVLRYALEVRCRVEEHFGVNDGRARLKDRYGIDLTSG